MSEDTTPEQSSIPPRVTIKIPSQSGEVGATPAAPALPGAKKKTSRISLDQVTAEPGAASASPVSGIGVTSKSIRILPSTAGQGTIAPLPPVGKALSGMMGDEAKRQTSRIPLAAVLPDSAKVGDAIPKTIKVKRPVLTPTPKVGGLPVETPAEAQAAPPPVTEEPPVAAAVEPSAKSQTARVDIIPEAAESQPTQKKTIKIRRADGGGADLKPSVRSVSIARTEGAPEGVRSAGPEVPPPHGVFVALAAAAVLVLCFMVYVLAAQAFPSLGWRVGV